MSRKWIPDTDSFTAALDKVHNEFRETIGGEIRESLEHQATVIEKLRHMEKHAAVMTAQISRQISKSDLSDIENESVNLEKVLENVELKMDQCIDKILTIDLLLPPADRLIVPGLQHTAQFPLLHDRICANSIEKTPSLLEVQRSKPETQVYNDHVSSQQPDRDATSSHIGSPPIE